MAGRLASTAQQVLSASGIDVVASLTGTSRSGTLTLIDPAAFPMTEQRLRRAGVRCARRSAVTVDVFLSTQKKKKEEEDRGDAGDFDSLISSWREFAKRSSDSGYKKAAKSIGPGYNPIEAARQIGTATLRLSKRSPLLRKIGRALNKAANARDLPMIKKLLARLTAGPSAPKPVLKNPKEVMRRPEEDQDNTDIFATPAASIRTADPEDIAFSSAQRFIMDYAHENALSAEAVRKLGPNPREAMDSWKQSAPDLPDRAYDAGWVDAANAVAQHLALETRRASAGWSGTEEGITSIFDTGREDFSNYGFAVTAAMDVPYDDKKIKSIVGRIIEHYVVDDDSGEPQHPSQITTAQVRSYLRKNAPDAPLKPIVAYLDKVTNRIPNRHDERKTNTASDRDADGTQGKKLDTAQPLQGVVNQYLSVFQKRLNEIGTQSPLVAQMLKTNYNQLKFKYGQQAADFFSKKATFMIQNAQAYDKRTQPAASRAAMSDNWDDWDKPTSFKVINFGGAGYVVQGDDGRYLSAFGKFPSWSSQEDDAWVHDSRGQANDAGSRAMKPQPKRKASRVYGSSPRPTSRAASRQTPVGIRSGRVITRADHSLRSL